MSGTGKQGRVTKGDVLAHISSGLSADPAISSTAHSSGDSEIIALNALKKTIADHMTHSWREIPHCFTHLEISAAEFLNTKSELANALGEKIPIEVFLIKAATKALCAYPNFNATFDGDKLLRHRFYNIGVATATQDGLIVPVVESADRFGVRDLTGKVIPIRATRSRRLLR